MNFLGMGTMEVLIVLLVAFIFLGPERMVDAARLMGKAVREVRRLSAELPRLDLDEDDESPAGAPAPGSAATDSANRKGGSSRNKRREPDGSGRTTPTATSPSSDAASSDEDGPVGFRSATGATIQDEADSAPKSDRA